MMENFGGRFCGGGGGRVCHGGGRRLRRGVRLGDRAFPGGLGDGHDREVGFQLRRHSAYQSTALLPHLVGCFARTTCN
jgi:hypothetical protein